MITQTEDYFKNGCGRCDRFATPDCSTRLWASGVAELRSICLATGLTETVKWGHPCYMHGERNIAIIGAFRGDFRLSFFNAALMKDPGNILEKSGPNSQTADLIRFVDDAEPDKLRPVIEAYLQEAIGYAQAGIKSERPPREIVLPDELVDALDADPAMAEAFSALTPGRQRSYVINLASAKTAATRIARIDKFRDKILSGKGATER